MVAAVARFLTHVVPPEVAIAVAAPLKVMTQHPSGIAIMRRVR